MPVIADKLVLYLKKISQHYQGNPLCNRLSDTVIQRQARGTMGGIEAPSIKFKAGQAKALCLCKTFEYEYLTLFNNITIANSGCPLYV